MNFSLLKRPSSVINQWVILALSLLLLVLATQMSFAQEGEAQPAANLVLDLSDIKDEGDVAQSNQPHAEDVALKLSATMTEKGANIEEGLVWRIYSTLVGADNKLTLIAKQTGGDATFYLPPNSYFVHVSFGKAQASKRIDIKKDEVLAPERFMLNAGGLILNASIPDGEVKPSYLTFSIFKNDNEDEDTDLILSDIKPGAIVRLPADTYHIVSYYGKFNSIVRADVRVDPGQITDVSLQHHASFVTLKLVRQEGGEAIADTSWSISNDAGDIVGEAVGAYVSMVLVDGDYIAIVKNKDVIYQKSFSVKSGADQTVEVIASEENKVPEDKDSGNTIIDLD